MDWGHLKMLERVLESSVSLSHKQHPKYLEELILKINVSGDLKEHQTVFHYMYSNHQIVKDADWLPSSSFGELEPTEFSLNPNVLPVVPLPSDSHPNGLAGNLWKEDSTCLEYLDQQPACSVIMLNLELSQCLMSANFISWHLDLSS
ncbi:hypothetical protein RJ641_022941 [Dillenia turbinata]|uniref:Uncharacterized protein n=1 Tax=Dillenia turbinata TaxID=194707 RepID=A0AAN8UDF2_9MAGN